LTPREFELVIERLPQVVAQRKIAAEQKDRLQQLEVVAGKGPEHPSVKLLRDELQRSESKLAELRTKAMAQLAGDPESPAKPKSNPFRLP
jgi:hypothetical protein